LDNITNLGTELKSGIVKKLIQDDLDITMVLKELSKQQKRVKTTEEESVD
jgi:hypothetical protein